MNFLKALTLIVFLVGVGFVVDGSLFDLGLILLVEGGVLATLITAQ